MSLMVRAAVAVLLIVFFFAFALASVTGLAWAGWQLGTLTVENMRGQVALFGLVAALTCERAAVLS